MSMPAENINVTLLPGVFIIFLTIIFGGNAVAIKLALTGMGPLTTAGLRFGLAAIAIACWARMTGRPFRLQSGQMPQVLIVSIVFTLQLCLFYLGMHRTYASRGVLIANLLPFFVLVLSHFFIPGEQMTVRKMGGILLGFGGVAAMFVDSRGLLTSWHPGDGIVLAAVLLWSGNVVFTKRIIGDYSPFQLVLYPMIFSAPIFLLAGYVWDPRMIFALNPTVIGAYAYQSLVTAAFGFVAWNTMLKRYGASTLHAFVFIMPIAGVVFSGWLLQEPITPHIIVALALIAAGIWLVHATSGKPVSTFIPGRGI